MCTAFSGNLEKKMVGVLTDYGSVYSRSMPRPPKFGEVTRPLAVRVPAAHFAEIKAKILAMLEAYRK